MCPRSRSIYAGTKGFLDKIPPASVGRFEREMLAFIRANHASILESIKKTGKLDDAVVTELRSALGTFLSTFDASKA